MKLAPFLPYQAKMLNLCEESNVTVVEKSRRTGMSWAASFIGDIFAAKDKSAGGMDVFYMGYNLEMAREFIDYAAEHAKILNEALGLNEKLKVTESFWKDHEDPDKDIKVFRINLRSGFKILALPSAPRSLRGMQGLAIIDEAAFHKDLKEVLKAALAFLMWGGKVLIISTHNGDTNPFNELIQDIRAGRKPYALMRLTLDDALKDGLYKRICHKLGRKWSQEAEDEWRKNLIKEYGDAADEELFCVPSASKGAYLPLSLIEARQEDGIPVLRWERKDSYTLLSEHLREKEAAEFFDWKIRPFLLALELLYPKESMVFGGDFGRSGDLSVFWFLGLSMDLKTPTRFLLELRNIPFEQQRQILHAILAFLGSRFRAGKMDARGNGQYLAEVTVQKFGSKVEAVMLSESWYRENMPRFKAAFEDASITIPKDREIQDDLRSLQVIRGVARVPDQRTAGESGKRHGDAAIAGCLAVAASRAEVIGYGYQPIPLPWNKNFNLAEAKTGEEFAMMEDMLERQNGFGLRGTL